MLGFPRSLVALVRQVARQVAREVVRPVGLAVAVVVLVPESGVAQVPTFSKAWEHRIEKRNKERLPDDDPKWLAKNPQADNPWWTEVLLSADEQQVLVLKPDIIRVYSAVDGTLQWEQGRNQFFRLFASTSAGMEQAPASTFYVPVPHLNAVLDLYYGNRKERISFVDLQTQQVRWVNEDLQWSLERYAFLARQVLDGVSNRGQQLAGSVTADFLMPERLVTTLVRQVPEVNGLLVKTIGGLTMLDLTTGTVRWESSEFKGGLAFLHYDAASKDLILVNRDDDAFAIPGIQLRKQLLRINAETGMVRWSGSYVGAMIDRVDGVIGNYSNRTADVRIVGNVLLINFLDLQAYDLETGRRLWHHPTTLPRLVAMMSPEANITNRFAFPRIADGVIYRPAMASGMSTEMLLEAIDLTSGNTQWVAEKLSRGQGINSLVVLEDRVIVSFDGNAGVAALSRATGAVLWKTPMPTRELQEHLIASDGIILVRVGNGLVGLDAQTGAKRYEVDAKTLKIAGTGLLAAGAGQLSQSLVTDGIATIAGPIGMAMVKVSTGQMLAQVAYPAGRRGDLFQYRVARRSDGRALLSPTNSIGSVVLADITQQQVLGLLPTSATRTRLVVTRDGTRAFAMDDGLLQRFDMR